MPMSRRDFLAQVGTAIASAGSVEDESAPPRANAPALVGVQCKINGATHSVEVQPRVVLLDFLREVLGLTGTKKGCDHGQCGSCTILVNGRRVKSCLSLLVMHEGDEITTIEGLEQHGELHPMQQAFLDHDGYQCGYCTAGQIMSAVALTSEPIGPDDTAVRDAMSGNICRCGAYKNICAAIQSVRARS